MLAPKGKITIGIGRNLEANPLDKEEQRFLLQRDLSRTVAELEKALPWATILDDIRYAVLVEMAFNMGIGGLLTFKNTLAMIKSHQFGAAADAMLQSKWAAQVRGRAVRLSKSMATGKWHLQ